MALKVESIVDGGMHAQKALGEPGWFETLALSRKPGWESAYREDVCMAPLCYRRHRFPP
jgi:hypothetical protein